MPAPEERSSKAPEDRLGRLELTVRRWRMTTWVLAGVVGLLVACQLYFTISDRNVVRTRRIEILNDKGIAIELAAAPSGEGFMSLRNAEGIPRVMMGTSRRGAGMVDVFGNHDHRVAGLYGTGSGGMLAIFNNTGNKVVDVQASKTNCGAIVVNNYDGEYREGMTGDKHY